MTWGEIKQAVADEGVKDDHEIDFLDTEFIGVWKNAKIETVVHPHSLGVSIKLIVGYPEDEHQPVQP